jgi:uncharacterized SAM-binding protein YcdF (DUF218 family)
MSLTRLQRAVAILRITLAAAAMVGAGRLVAHEDPLEHADAIYILGGSWVQRWLEATDLYHEGYAPHIVFSRDRVDDATRELARRGVRLPSAADVGRDTMIRSLKVPADAVEVLPTSVDNTAQEADAIRSVALEHQWRRLIVITDRASTRRAGFAMRRVLGSDIDVIMRAPRFDSFRPSRWWATRPDFRSVFYEGPKLLAYWLGLRG